MYKYNKEPLNSSVFIKIFRFDAPENPSEQFFPPGIGYSVTFCWIRRERNVLDRM